MIDVSDVNARQLPSSGSLIKATAVALIASGVLLVVAVLPAEYGFDPTGIGQRLGLTALAHGSSEPSSAVAVGPSQHPVAEFRTDSLTLTLEAGKGAEIKASMQTGDRMFFSWDATGGVVNFDMHGEAANAEKDEYTSYWRGRNAASGGGAFVAPFAGTHGWFWKNRGTSPVTITVRTSGYYEKLYRP